MRSGPFWLTPTLCVYLNLRCSSPVIQICTWNLGTISTKPSVIPIDNSRSSWSPRRTTQLWHGLHAIMGHKAKFSNNISLPIDLISNRKSVVWHHPVTCTCNHAPVIWTPSDIRSAREWTRKKPHILRTQVNQLSAVFMDIFNLFSFQSEVPLQFKTTTIIPMPSRNKVACLTVQRLLHPPLWTASRGNSNLPDSLDPVHAISLIPHLSLEHLDNEGTWARLLNRPLKCKRYSWSSNLLNYSSCTYF